MPILGWKVLVVFLILVVVLNLSCSLNVLAFITVQYFRPLIFGGPSWKPSLGDWWPPHKVLIYYKCYYSYVNSSLHLAQKHPQIFVQGIICSKKWIVFWECSSRKTVSFEKHITSKNRYPSIFSRQMEGMFIILHLTSNVFLNPRSLENWGISLGYSPVLARTYSVTWHVYTNRARAKI